MEKVGFIGLGIMGFPMAKHLKEAKYELTVFNRTSEKAKELVAKGAYLAERPSQVANKSDIVFIMLSNNNVIEDVIFNKDGLIEGVHPGLVVVNCSTVSPKFNIEMSERLSKHGVKFLDAPVTGSGVQANAGTLTFMCGGDETIYKRCEPLFNIMGKKSLYMGGIGAGSYTKLANNIMLAINMMSLAEAIVLVKKCGIDPEKFVEVVSGGGSKSAMAEAKTPKIVNRDFSPSFKSSLMLKDVRLALDLAREKEFPVPILSVSKDILQITDVKGYGDEDLCAVVKCYEEWAGVVVEK